MVGESGNLYVFEEAGVARAHGEKHVGVANDGRPMAELRWSGLVPLRRIIKLTRVFLFYNQSIGFAGRGFAYHGGGTISQSFHRSLLAQG